MTETRAILRKLYESGQQVTWNGGPAIITNWTGEHLILSRGGRIKILTDENVVEHILRTSRAFKS